MSTAAAATTPMTADEFFEWVHRPDNTNRWFELVRGEVIELPAPTKRHGVVSANVVRILGNYAFQRRKGYVTSNDSGVILERDPDTVRGPDVALYEDAQTFAELHPKYGEIPPRLAVEVLSPSDRASQVMRKITDYLRTGVGLVWVIDPEAQTVTVYRPDKAPAVLEGGQELTGAEVLTDFRCRVADLFVMPGDQPPAPQPPPSAAG
jgi:Uma2 family endonuclease